MDVLMYLNDMPYGMVILWCFMIWYIYFVIRYFDPSPDIWFRSVGIAILVGIALNINSFGTYDDILAADRYQVFRFFLIPFCVSSFPALLKGKGILVFSKDSKENITAMILCGMFVVIWYGVKHLY